MSLIDPKKNQGFTVLQTAMVLVIIGLMFGGIVIAQNMIRNAQLQSVINDEDRYKKVVMLFKDKYNYLPGDMPAANSFWATATNGNGDGFVGDSNGSALGNAAAGMESFYLWQDLADAGFIEGSYTGTWSAKANQEVPGVNTPASQVPKGTFLVLFALPASSSSSGIFAANYRHIMVFGASNGATNNQPSGYGPYAPYMPVLTTTEAMMLDQKMDDGFPGSGNVMSYTNAANAYGTTLTCANGTTSTAIYDMTKSGNQCSLIFITGF